MQKKNTVIKNYILSTEKRILQENPFKHQNKPVPTDNLKYRLLLKQNTEHSSSFLLRK